MDRTMTAEWWVTTEDGARVAGPFTTAADAAVARMTLEEESGYAGENLWVRLIGVPEPK